MTGPLLPTRSKGGNAAAVATSEASAGGDATGGDSAETRASGASGASGGEASGGGATKGHFAILSLSRWFSSPPQKVQDKAAGEEQDELEVMFNINTAEALLLGTQNNNNSTSASTNAATTAATANGQSVDIGNPDINVPPPRK